MPNTAPSPTVSSDAAPDQRTAGQAERTEPLTPEQILLALDSEQREAARALVGPVCILAGAGTGKTRAITHRIAYGVLTGAYKPQQVLAVTFTHRAAAEMRSRLAALGVPGVQARTFHSAALRQLQYFWPQTIGGGVPQIVPHKVATIAEACSRLRMSVDRAALRDIATELEWAKVSMILPEEYPRAAARERRDGVSGFEPSTLARIFARYEDVKTERMTIDFEDVLLTMIGIMDDDKQVAERIRSQYRHFVVDEYQDVSPLQQRLLELWLGDRRDLCVVGDASQTIYSFAGASPQHLLGFDRRFRDATVVRLVRDYRSTPQVVGAANTLLDGGRGSTRKNRLELKAQRAAGPDVRFTEYPDDVAEADGVAAAITDRLERGTPLSEMAVLFRTNGQSEALEQALAGRGLGYLVRGGERFFNRTEVRQAMLTLRGAARAMSDVGEDMTVGQAVRDVLGSAGWAATAPAASGAIRDRWESLNALVGLADEIGKRPDATLDDVVAELNDRANAQHAPTVEGVTLASLHSAKGLEWDAVWLVGVSDGLLPISMADGEDEIEEERRLLYVGITRAREHLSFSWARARNPGGRGSRRPSRFLDGLRPNDVEREAGAAAPRTRKTTSKRSTLFTDCKVCGKRLESGSEQKVGRCLDCPPTYDEQTYAALRDWRLATSRETKVPAYVVFTDATLTAIAERRPTSEAQLAEVPGVGPSKLDRFGAAVLAILAESHG